MNGSNLVLIGMPGAGKSTLGVLLAKHRAKAFVDTDLLIQDAAGKTLQAIVDEQGYRALRQLEEETLCGLDPANAVIATGGSAVYSERAMQHLKALGPCIYLRLSLTAVQERVKNLGTRGIAAEPGVSLADIYAERQPLYERYADITIECNGRAPDDLLAEINRLSHL